MNRDELARHLYIHSLDTNPAASYRSAQMAVQKASADEWDRGWVTDEDRADCYARADQQLAEGVAR